MEFSKQVKLGLDDNIKNGLVQNLECFPRTLFDCFSRPWDKNLLSHRDMNRLARVDFINNEKELILKTYVPCNHVVDLQIDYHKESVTVKCGVLNSETKKYPYLSRIPLPEKIEKHKASSQLEDGILTLTLPKAELKSRLENPE